MDVLTQLSDDASNLKINETSFESCSEYEWQDDDAGESYEPPPMEPRDNPSEAVGRRDISPPQVIAPVARPARVVRQNIDDFDLQLWNDSISKIPSIEETKDMTGNSKKVEQSKTKVEERFFGILNTNDDFAKMSEFVLDEQGINTRRLYVIVCGPKSQSKYIVLNNCMVFFVKHLKYIKYKDLPADATDLQKAMLEYQPNSLLANVKRLFAILSRHGIVYRFDKDFNGMGGFAAWLIQHWKAIQKIRPDFGTRPNKSYFDWDEDRKMLLSDEQLLPFEKPQDAMWKFYWESSKKVGFRAKKEVSFPCAHLCVL